MDPKANTGSRKHNKSDAKNLQYFLKYDVISVFAIIFYFFDFPHFFLALDLPILPSNFSFQTWHCEVLFKK